MALPIIDIFFNVNPFAASDPIIAQKNVNRSGVIPVATLGDCSTYRFWFYNIDPGASSGTTVRLNDTPFALGGREDPGYATSPYLLAATAFTEGGAEETGWYYETPLDFSSTDLAAAFTYAPTRLLLAIKVDIEYQNADNTQRQTTQFVLNVRRQILTGPPSTDPAVPPLPTAPVADTFLGGNADGSNWIQRTVAQVLTLLGITGVTTASTPGWSSTVVTLEGVGATALEGTNGVTDSSTIFTVNRLFAMNITGLGLKWAVLKAGTQETDGVSFVRCANYADGTFEYVFNIIG